MSIKRSAINIGVIGCGQWGANHVRTFYFLRKARLKICCDTNLARLKDLRKTYRGLDITADYKKVLNDKFIDAVIIATPTATHYELAKAALINGKHVLCEKPLAVKAAESEELVSLAREKRKVLMVGYIFLFNNGIIALKDCMDRKTLGKILYLHFTRTNLGPIRDDVDVVYDLASHDVSIASFLLGRWPECVSANTGFFLRKKIADIAFINLYYPDNIIVNIHVSWLDPRKVRQLTCVGDKKMALWDDLNPSEPIKIFDKKVIREFPYSDYGEFQLLPRDGGIISPTVKLSEPMKAQNNHFLDCIARGKKPLTDAALGNNVSKVLEAIRLSAKNGGSVSKVR